MELVEGSVASETTQLRALVSGSAGAWRSSSASSRCPIASTRLRPRPPARPEQADVLRPAAPDQVDFVVGQVTAKVGAPAAVPLNLITDARRKLEATIEQGDGTAFKPRGILGSPQHAAREPSRYPHCSRLLLWQGLRSGPGTDSYDLLTPDA